MDTVWSSKLDIALLCISAIRVLYIPQDTDFPAFPLANFILASSLSPRVTIVTGAAQGVGLSIAQRLAGDGLADVLNDVPSNAAVLSTIAQEIEADGGVPPLCYPGDVTVEANVRDMVEAAVKKWGKSMSWLPIQVLRLLGH